MRIQFIDIILLFFIGLTLLSCDKEVVDTPLEIPEPSTLTLPETPFNYENIEFPAHFLSNALVGPVQNAVIENDNTPNSNPISNDGATLGRVLFYDVNLSQNKTISCASCHIQSKGFSDPDIFSKGFNDGDTRRHSMGLTNARFYLGGKFFWDERANSLEDQVLMPIQDEVEMGLTLEELVNRVSTETYYDDLFSAAFGDNEVSTDRIAKALAQFVRSMVSFESKYDEGRAMVNNPTQPFPNFTQDENLGKTLFMGPPNQGGRGCIGCHATEAFINSANGPTNNGLDAFSNEDLGVFESSGLPGQVGSFKVPSLRNVADRAPYMHDGRFESLEEVIEHYNSGIQDHPNLAPALRDPQGNPVQMNLNQVEKDALIAFLNTLSDDSFLEDPKFSDPFK